MSAKPSFFARRGIIILMVIFFLVPFALRGARMSVQGMKNDLKDWLPKDFPETADLDWFRQHFVSETFVVASWEGCHGTADDARFQLFMKKLEPEVPPSKQVGPKPAEQAAAANGETASEVAPEAASGKPQDAIRYFHREEFIGDQLGLYLTSNLHENWGGQGEKWLRGRSSIDPKSNSECWYYITPEGDLYRWTAVDAPLMGVYRLAERKINGPSVAGELVASFGPKDGAWYHQEPRRLRAQLFKSVTTGPAVLQSLVGTGGELSELKDPEAEAFRRLQGTLYGPADAHNPSAPRQTCVVLTLTDAARANLHLVVGRGMLGKPFGRLYELAEDCNIAKKDHTGEGLWLGGPPVDNVAIDEEGTITLVRLIGLTALLGTCLSLACFRSISATIMVFFIGGISAVMSIAFVWWCGSSMDAILMSMPALVYVLGLSGAAHIINYYHEAVTDHGYAGAPERAISHGWKPAMFCNITTAIGLVSLITSELVPIQKFGVFSAIGVMATLIVLFTYLPAALQIWPQKRRAKLVDGQNEGPWLEKYLGGFWNSLGSFIIKHHALVALGCTATIVVFCYGIKDMKTSVNMLKMFNSQAKIIRDYTHLEEKLGPLMPMEVVVSIPKASQRLSDAELGKAKNRDILAEQIQLPFIDRMEVATRVQQVIEQEFGPNGRGIVGNSTSAASFVRPLPGIKKGSIRSMTSARLEAHKDDFIHSDFLRDEAATGAELWRISLRIPATQGTDYGAFNEQLKEAIEPVMLAQRERDTILKAVGEHKVQLAKQAALKRGTEFNPASIKLAAAKVLLLGVPAQVAAEEAGSKATVAAGPVVKPETNSPVDQAPIFARTLRDLLRNARLKVAIDAPAANVAPHDWSKLLAGYDCVVLVNNHASYDLAEIQKHAQVFVDASKSRFAPPVGASMDEVALAVAYKQDASKIGAVYTGVVPIVYKAQRALLDSLISSSIWSFLTITPLMMFISRSFWAGIVSMLPNVLPVVMVFGGMGWLGIDVDVGSMMTASIALGVAVDDTIHFLNWYREELDRLGDRKQAILAAYKHCATPTFQAAIISGLGLSVFALSTFTPTQRFGYLMLVILWMGVAAELIFFPALLAGPLGLVFKPRKKKDQPARPMHPELVGATAEELAAAKAEAAASNDVVLPNEQTDERTDKGHAGGVPAPSKAGVLRSLRQEKKG
ncbi:MAG: efflux RND transporter permease subunit [Pirellulaceae bacterium]